MSAYKKLNKQDVYITAYNARKKWQVSGSTSALYTDYSIEVIRGKKPTTTFYKEDQIKVNNRYEELVWSSINHLYYSSVNSEGLITGSFDNYFESSFVTGSRHIQDAITIYSIPQSLFGSNIEPFSLVLQPLSGSGASGSYNSAYIEDDYVVDPLTFENLYIEKSDYLYGSRPDDCITWDSSSGQFHRPEIVDNGEGVLIFSGSNIGLPCLEPSQPLGNIIYSHGQIIITDPIISNYYNSFVVPKITWKSNHPIYTYNVHCKVKDSELNFTLNPTAVESDEGDIASNLIVPEFQPYVTSVGLYNDANELIAVGKLSKPVPKSNSTDMTFVVKIDI